MAIDSTIKKNIAEDWFAALPNLRAFTQNKFYRVVGCCILGVELIKLPHSEEYRPHFVIYSLLESDITKCLEAPVAIVQLYNDKGLQLNIPYGAHSAYFEDAVRRLRVQIPLVDKRGDIDIEMLHHFIDERFNDILVKSNPGQQGKLYQFKMLTALYVGNESKVQNVLDQVKAAKENWNMAMFEGWHGNFDVWYNKLNHELTNRSAFLRKIGDNKNDKKVKGLPVAELI